MGVCRSTSDRSGNTGSTEPEASCQTVLTVVLAAAWWYERAVNPVCAASFDWFYVPVRKRFGHVVAWRIATFFKMQLLPSLMCGQLAWMIAEDHLRAKWNAELRAENARKKS